MKLNAYIHQTINIYFIEIKKSKCTMYILYRTYIDFVHQESQSLSKMHYLIINKDTLVIIIIIFIR